MSTEVQMVEINESNYCNQKPITVEISFVEHDFLNHILNHAMNAYEFTGYEDIFEMPDNSEMKVKYEMLISMKEKIHQLWMHRFDSPPYDNS